MSIKDAFKIDNRRTRIRRQDRERPPVGARDTFAVTDDLYRDIRPLGYLHEMITLIPHNPGTAHNAQQGRLIDDRPQPGSIILIRWQAAVSVKYLLPGHPKCDRALYFLVRHPRPPGADDGTGIVLRFQQPRYLIGIIFTYLPGF